MQTDSAGPADGPPLTSHVDLSQGGKVTGPRQLNVTCFIPSYMRYVIE